MCSKGGDFYMFQAVLSYIGDNMALFGAYAVSIFSAICSLVGKKSTTTSDIVQEDLEKLIAYHEGVAKSLKEKMKKEGDK